MFNIFYYFIPFYFIKILFRKKSNFIGTKQKLIHLRKEKDIMVYGTYELLDPEDEALYVYTRTLGDQKLLVMCNFTKEEQEYTVPETFAGADVLISNYPQSGAAAGARKLRAYEAVVLETK